MDRPDEVPDAANSPPPRTRRTRLIEGALALSTTYAERGGRRRPPWKTTLLGVLLALDAVITLLPQLYWAAGSSGRASTALLYTVGGSAFVLASIMAMYAIDRLGPSHGEGRS